jgi:hypothetical protein
MPLKIDEIKFLKDEKKIAHLQKVKVEMKGIGPSIQVITNSEIIRTNKRIIIGQKILFSSRYQVRFMIWDDANQFEKLSFLAGSIETSLDFKNINEIEIKGKIVTEIRPGGYIDYIRIFANKSDLAIHPGISF